MNEEYKFEIGDAVKIKNSGGFYSNYYKMAQYFLMRDWEEGRYPDMSETFKIVGIRKHYNKLERIVAGIENSVGEGYLFELRCLKLVDEPIFELEEELFLV